MKPVKVSQVNKYIKTVLQSDPLLSKISVVGEISNLKYHGSGHVYFSLKDYSSRLSCFLPSDRVKHLRYPLEEGMEIIASGYIYLYEKGGSYSLNISDIKIEGEGSLAAAYEKLKQKLMEKGYFDQDNKKPLPFFPRRIGIATSGTGAAVWDMIRTVRNKNPYVDIVVCPCRVQGDGAAGDIADAVSALNRMEEPPDVIILGRGGGSAEELWAFNEEITAESIFNSGIPVISAVGHETDFTIADFTADYRAATPTAAAEAAVPDIGMLCTGISGIMKEILEKAGQMMDERQRQVERFSGKELIKGLEERIASNELRADSLIKEVVLRFREKLHSEELKITQMKNRVDSLDPVKMTERGFGIVTNESGMTIKSVDRVEINDSIGIIFKDGKLNCRVTEIEKSSLNES